MNYWVKVSIAAVSAAAFVGFYFLDEHMSEKKKETEKVEARALNFEAAKVRRVSLVNGQGKFVFERENATTEWKMVEPAGKANPDQEAVSGVVGALESLNTSIELSETEKVVSGSSLDEKKPFGLDNPRVVVEIGLEGGASKKIEVGADMDIGTKTGGKFEAVSAYGTSSERQTVVVLNAPSIVAFQKGFSDFRTKAVGSFKTADVKSFSVTKKDGAKIRVVKGDKDWNLSEPRSLLADSNNVSVFLNTLSTLKSDKVTEKEMISTERLAALGLDAPETIVEVFAADDKVLQVFKFGKTKDGNSVFLPDGSAGSFGADKWKDVSPELKFFRDRRVLREVAIAEVSRIRTAAGKVYNKEGAAWYLAGSQVSAPSTPAPSATAVPSINVGLTPTPAGKTASSEASTFFSDWEFLTADDVIDGPEVKNLAAYGLDKPSTRFSLEFSDPKKEGEVILVGNKVSKDDKMVYVKRANRDAVYVVDTNWLATLDKLDGKASESK